MQQAQSSNKYVALRSNDYVIYFEDIGVNRWLHCDVFKWNKSVLKQLRKDAQVLMNKSDVPWLALGHPKNDLKLEKFFKLLGFQYFTDLSGYKVFRRT